MVLKHWLVSLKQRIRFTARPNCRKEARNRRLMSRSVPAQTEFLEDRTLLTAFVVDTLADSVAVDGFVSLREAIQSANTNTAVNADVAMGGEADGDSITFDESISGGTIVLGLGQLDILDDLTIDGADPLATEANITINGAELFRIFSIDTSMGAGMNMDVSLSNLNLEAGSTLGSPGDDGGAILIADGENVTLDSLSITGSTAEGNGGAIFAGDGTLTITNSQIGNDLIDNDFWSNTVTDASFEQVFVFVDVATGTPILDVLNNSGSTIAAPVNPVVAGLDEATNGLEDGDVFYNVSSASGPLTDYNIYASVVDTTTATAESEVNDASLTADPITEDTLVTGEVTTMLDVDYFAVDLEAGDDRLVVILDNDPDDDLTVTMTLVEILDTDGSTVLASGMFPGGTADAAIATELTGDEVYFVRISSSGGGTGTYSFVAKALGAGDQFDEEEPNNTRDLADLIFLDEFGQGDITQGGGNQAVNGGGIFVDGGTLNLDFTAVNNNIATGVNSDLGGGGIYSLGGTVNITNSSSVSFNSATGTLGSGGGILANGGTLTITDSIIDGNTAVRAGGGLETRSTVTAVTVNITDTSIQNNVTSANPGNGGGIHVTSPSGSNATTVTITGGNITANFAASEGGGLWNDVTGTMTISGVNIDDNIASGDALDNGGGGVFNNGGTVIIQSNGLSATSISGNIADGDLGSGGGILNDGGTLTITGATITGNSANRAGGGIEVTTANSRNSVVTLSNVTLSSNVATGTLAAPGNGGGVHISDATGGNTSTFTISGGTVTGNSAAEEGGGLWNDVGGTMTINNVSITSNTASGNSADQGGGGVFNNGGTVSITGGSVSSNLANGTSGSGGGILNDGGTLNINGTTIDGNSAVRAGGGIEATTANSRNSIITVTNAFITNNVVGSNPGNGGGVHISDAAGGSTSTFTMNGGVVTGNSAAAEGGGLWNALGGTMTINGTFIANNTASGNSADQGGGGIFNEGGTLNILNTLGPTIILNNVANGASGSGGGILNDGGNLNITGAIILANSAVRAGGGIEVTTANGRDSVATLTNVTIANNTAGSNPGRGGGVHITDAAGGNTSTFTVTGGSVTGNSAAEEGGGLWNDIGGTLTLDNVTVSGNIASGNSADNGGGGVFNNGGTVSITGSSISNNTANGLSGSGGGILNDGGTLTITGGTILANSAARAGGGIEVTTINARDSVATLTNVIIGNNTAGSNPGNGGGVHISDAAGGNASTFTITGGSVSDNSAAAEGGGLWNDIGGTMTINGVLITRNTASGNSADQGGGGVFNNGGTITIQSNGTTATEISDNIANGTLGSGGGILNDGGTLTITGATIEGNSAVRAGGGIEATTANSRDSDITIESSTLSDNTAGSGPGNGGAVHISDAAGGNSSTFTIEDSMVTDNSAASEGGGLWNDAGGSLFIIGTTISGNTASGALATNGGGGVFNNGGMTGILDSTITNNVANGSLGSGGGVFNDAGGTMNILGSSITSNTANRAGGGIEDNAGAFTLLANVTLNNNVASGMGGGPGNGGGLHITGAGTVQIIGGTVTGNSAANEGGGLWNSSGGTLLVGSETSTLDDPFIDEATGMNASDIQTAVDNFRNSLGTLNANTPGSVNGGRREINWDGAPDSVSAPNTLPGDFFNDPSDGLARGIEFTTPGTGFQLSASAASMAGVDFSNINPNYDDVFEPFSIERMFTPIGSNVTVINFFVPGTDIPATVTGFGAVFSDVDSSTSTLMEFFDKDGNLITSRNVLATSGDETFSFTGVSFTEAVIAQVRITTGTTALGAGVDDGGAVDLVVMDDFIFGEPVAIAESNTVISGNTASGASASNGGGGIFNDGGILSVVEATISGNTANGASGNGGGIFNEVGGLVDISRTTISGNIASGSAGSSGGGIFNLDFVQINDSTLSANSAASEGGGVANSGTLQLSQVTLSGNTAGTEGGGVLAEGTGSTDIRNSTITLNRATTAGGGISIDGTSANVYLESTIVAENLQGTTTPSDVDGMVLAASQFNLIGVDTGLTGITNGTQGNIIGTAAMPIDPQLGVLADNGGPTLTHSLLANSPAINAGSNPDALDFDQRGEGFPRVIGGQADIGAVEAQINLVAVGPGPGEDNVNVYNALTGALLASITPYPGFFGGIRTAVADVNGDEILDVITATGPGAGPHVKVFSGADNFVTELFSFFAFDPGFTSGMYVAAANFNPGEDDNADIVIGADAGGGSHVLVFNGTDLSVRQSFFAYGTAFTGGVRVGTGDINGDSIPDIITGAGPGAGPHVRVFDGALMQMTLDPTDIRSFFAFDPNFTGGIFVAGGDINGDDRDDIIVGAGAAAPHVRVFSGIDGSELLSFFAYDVNFGGGVRVGSTQGPDGDGIADIITGTGPGAGPHVKIFKGGIDPTPANPPEELASFFAFDPSFTGGVFVSGGAVGAGADALLFGGGTIAGDAGPLSQGQLDALVDAAIARLESAGASSAQVDALSTLDIRVSSLADGVLGLSLPGQVLIDVDASGAGWFIDASPLDDGEFDADLNATEAAALGRVDLLTVLLHELGHQLGAGDLDIISNPENLMAESLTTGKRRLPNDDLDALFANGDLLGSVLY